LSSRCGHWPQRARERCLAVVRARTTAVGDTSSRRPRAPAGPCSGDGCTLHASQPAPVRTRAASSAADGTPNPAGSGNGAPGPQDRASEPCGSQGKASSGCDETTPPSPFQVSCRIIAGRAHGPIARETCTRAPRCRSTPPRGAATRSTVTWRRRHGDESPGMGLGCSRRADPGASS